HRPSQGVATGSRAERRTEILAGGQVEHHERLIRERRPGRGGERDRPLIADEGTGGAGGEGDRVVDVRGTLSAGGQRHGCVRYRLRRAQRVAGGRRGVGVGGGGDRDLVAAG